MATMPAHREHHKASFCVIGIGGNFQETESRIGELQGILHARPDLSEVQFSSIITTVPDSDIPQPPYLNCAATFRTELDPYALFEALEAIEIKLGKKKKPKNSPRLIDIDLIAYGDLIQEDPHLTLPHPRWFEREFVIVPLMELIDILQVGAESVLLAEYYREHHTSLQGKIL
jgi:2-amino-4-hydroxy-6-hydroxymethyldihydropteridine diphosphokinase